MQHATKIILNFAGVGFSAWCGAARFFEVIFDFGVWCLWKRKKQWHLCFSFHVLVLAAGDPARQANRPTRSCSTRQRNVHGRVWTWIWHFGLRSVIPSTRKCCSHWMVVAYVIGASARAAAMWGCRRSGLLLRAVHPLCFFMLLFGAVLPASFYPSDWRHVD